LLLFMVPLLERWRRYINTLPGALVPVRNGARALVPVEGYTAERTVRMRQAGAAASMLSGSGS
jgi:hypothetical protein